MWYHSSSWCCIDIKLMINRSKVSYCYFGTRFLASPVQCQGWRTRPYLVLEVKKLVFSKFVWTREYQSCLAFIFCSLVITAIFRDWRQKTSWTSLYFSVFSIMCLLQWLRRCHAACFQNLGSPSWSHPAVVAFQGLKTPGNRDLPGLRPASSLLWTECLLLVD